MSTTDNPTGNSAKRLKLSLKSRRLNQNAPENVENDVKNEEFNKKFARSSYASLANLGNTCFMNTVLNVLRYSPGFTAYLHSLCQLIGIVKESTNDFIPLCWELVSQLHKVFSALSDVEKRVVRKEEFFGDMVIQPQELLSILRQLNPLFDGNYQHDAHELLCCLLNYVREAEHGVMSAIKGIKDRSKFKRSFKSRNNQSTITGFFEKKKNSTTDNVKDSVTDTFESRMALLTKCTECENSSEMKEVFLNVTVSPHSNERDSSDEDSNDEKSDWTWFREAMLKTETLNGDNKYWCETCLRYNEATRSHKFLTLPPVLIIQLKRFTSSFNSLRGFSKVSDFIPTPPNLECLLDQCQTPCSNCTHSYRLYAVISHSGLSLTSGHYTALVKRNKYPQNNHIYLRETLRKAQKDLEEQAKSAIKTRQKSKEENSQFCVKSYAKESQHEDCCDLVVEETNWLQYDDEKVNSLSEEEFKELLSSPKNTSWTPYLLFYSNNLHNS